MYVFYTEAGGKGGDGLAEEGSVKQAQCSSKMGRERERERDRTGRDKNKKQDMKTRILIKSVTAELHRNR